MATSNRMTVVQALLNLYSLFFLSSSNSCRLNHCVGGRNYVAFLMCVVSAVMGASVILATVIGELVLYYMKSDLLTIWSLTTTTTSSNSSSGSGGSPSNLTDLIPTDASANETFSTETDSISSAIFNETFFVTLNETVTIPPETVSSVTGAIFEIAHESIRSAGMNLHVALFLTFISIIGILAAVTVGLLLHLCFFHVYISFLGLTTYEYIRNQRYLENQNSLKNSTSKSTSNKTTHTSNNTINSTKSSANQMYFCSHVDPKNLIESHGTATAPHRTKSIHCCDTTMQYENSMHKAFYICSVLHDRPSPILVPSSMAHELTLHSSRASRSKTFHCCSEYKHIVKLSGASSSHADGYGSGEDPPPSLPNDETTTTEPSLASTAGEHVNLVEQCTFCSFKLKTNRQSKVATSETNGSYTLNHRSDVDVTVARKRTWNCCSPNGPHSADSDISDAPQIDTISASIDPKANRNHINQRLKSSYDKQHLHAANGAKSPGQLAESTANGAIVKPSSGRGNRTTLTTNLKSNGGDGGKRSRAKRKAWPVRFQHMLRMFGRCQQPHSLNDSDKHINSANHSRQLSPSPRRSVKQNQIRPMDRLEQQCEELKQQRRQQMQQLHDTITMPKHLHNNKSGGSSGGSSSCSSSDDNESLQNRMHDENVPMSKMKQPPAPPPPVRRKINTAADMQELAESLSFVQNPSHHHHHYPSRVNKQKDQNHKAQPPPPPRPLLMVNRKRRKNIFRSPNLSPIHETGYSNPTSPKPYRHSMNTTTPRGSDSSSSTPKFAHQF